MHSPIFSSINAMNEQAPRLLLSSRNQWKLTMHNTNNPPESFRVNEYSMEKRESRQCHVTARIYIIMIDEPWLPHSRLRLFFLSTGLLFCTALTVLFLEGDRFPELLLDPVTLAF